ncbi:MAG: CDP-glycerol glycerophosphotransferase family protein [Bacillota bacterium]
MQKREIYLENYWLLFLDFIDVFAKLTYNNIPLPVLANFYQYLDANLKEEMTKPDFKKHLNSKSISDAQIQPQFERWLNPLKQPCARKPVQGKVLLNFDYLRFSQNNYRYFDPKETVIFTRWQQNKYLGMPVHCINNYKVEVKKVVNDLIERAKVIFTSVNTHAVFNNQYFYNTFISLIPEMVERIAAVNRYLEENPTSCLLVGTTEDLISRILTIVAACKGIPSICMQHGLLGGDEAYLPAFSTMVAVYGHYEKDWYLNRGLSENRITITGHPRFDDIFTQSHMSKAEFQKKFEIDPKKIIIFIPSQPFNDSLWIQLVSLLAKNPSFEIIIKPHPWEISKNKYSIYEKLRSQYKSVKLFLSRKINIYDILPNVDIVVVNISTVGLEAMLFNKTVFFANNSFEYHQKMGMFAQPDPFKLTKLIIEFFKDKDMQNNAEVKRKEFLAYAYPEVLSKERLQNLIHNLTKGYGRV